MGKLMASFNSLRILLTVLAGLFFGLIYPAFQSILAIESVSSADDTQWLVYWLCFSLLTILESAIWPILKWVPLYREMKVALLAWLVLPQTKGAQWTYEAIISPGVHFLREKMADIPALEKWYNKIGGQPAQRRATTTRPPVAINGPETRQKIASALKGAEARLEMNMKEVDGIQDPAARKKAEKKFQKDVQKLENFSSPSAAFSPLGASFNKQASPHIQ